MKDWWKTHEFPPATCMMCGKECETMEILNDCCLEDGVPELWCYCKACKIDTFHPLIPIAVTA